MTLRANITFWAVSISIFLLFVFLFSSILMPFVLGFVIAYMLNPTLVKLNNDWRVPRRISIISLLTVFFVFVTLLVALIAPILYNEFVVLAKSLPGHIDTIYGWVEPHTVKLQQYLGNEEMQQLKDGVKSQAGSIVKIGKNLLSGVAGGGQAVVSFATTLVLTPIVAFFVMQEWAHITKWMENMMPHHQRSTIKDILKQIDTKLSGFVRGQLMVSGILALFYAVALAVAGLNYGFLIGLISGVLSIIPMVGSVIGLFVSVLVAVIQVWAEGDWMFVGIIAGIFIFGQIVEGNFLTPKLVGDSVGLHPLWVMFALMAGGAVLGILGMLLAVPVAAVIGVLVTFGIMQYKKSEYYKKKTTKTSAKTE